VASQTQGKSSVLDVLSPASRAALREMDQPQWLHPMLATLTDRAFSSPQWVFEHKLDGVRCLVFRRGRDIRIMSRNKKRQNETYPELVEALERTDEGEYVVDGEIVAFEGSRTSFAKLQGRIGISDPRRARRTGIAVYLYLFDVLHVDGYDMRELPLVERKGVLERLVKFEDPLRFTEHRHEYGETFMEEACEKGWEGLIAKRLDSRYQCRRSADWLKLKCVNKQELVIVGYTEPQGSRIGFGGLLLGYHDERGRLHYAGKVGTGFSDRLLRELSDELVKLRTKVATVEVGQVKQKDVHWVEAKLVGEVGFTEWTEDGRLRHPRFLGLRRDKDAGQVVREKIGAVVE
jgi:DNA ligase D-like protein (predicted ligase)